MRWVILRTAGKPDAVVMSTDLSLTPREIAGLYADRKRPWLCAGLLEASGLLVAKRRERL